MHVCIVGLGNIGTNLYTGLEAAGISPIGIDIDAARVDALKAEGFKASTNPQCTASADVVIITISTGPDCGNLLRLAESITLKDGAIISVESTLIPGTTNRIAEKLASRGYMPGKNMFLVHIPHRVLFGHDTSPLGMVRVIGGYTPKCMEAGRSFYSSIGVPLFPVADIRVAELSKVIENSLRFVEVAFAEETRRYCEQTGLDFATLRAAVNTKENIQLKEARLGIGGECLPKDIDFLYRSFPSPLFAGAIAAEHAYRAWMFERCMDAKSVLVQGLSFKPGHKDLRFSPGVDLVRRLMATGHSVYVQDPLFSPEELQQAGLTPLPAEVRPELTLTNF